MNNDITIEEWKAEYIKHIDGFIAHWKKSSVNDPKNYADKMWCADWDEQFYSYVGKND